MAITHCYIATDDLVVKNCNLTLLPTSSVQEWQFQNDIDVWWLRMAYFTLLLTCNGQEWQFHNDY